MRRLGTTILAGLVLALLCSAPFARAAEDRCQGQDDPVAAANVGRAERSLLCLVNLHRADTDAPPVAMDGSLHDSARAHSEYMVREDTFSYYGPQGIGPEDRAKRAGYPGKTVGESLVLDPLATPLTLFQALVADPDHNANLLRADWITAGIGLAIGHPSVWDPSTQHQLPAGSDGATATLDFGTARTAASDTAVDLLVTAGCGDARARRSADAKRVRHDRHALAQAQTAGEQSVARHRLHHDLAILQRAKQTVERACNPSSF